MGRFGIRRRRATGATARPSPLAFWRHGPLDAPTAPALRHEGELAVARGDGPTALASGWALWGLATMIDQDTHALLYEGFRLWSASPDHDPEIGVVFLTEAFERLVDEDAGARPATHPTRAHEAYFDARTWIGLKLTEALETAGRGEDLLVDRVGDVLRTTPEAYRTPGARAFLERATPEAPRG
ncbi:MAG: hypothetical protein AAGC46_00795 [Solirubrobacteraceae bacterium]|nr:hypothetical protein [Patulibacter sp.]